MLHKSTILSNLISYLDISINGAKSRRLNIKLFEKTTPKAAENFKKLCTGELSVYNNNNNNNNNYIKASEHLQNNESLKSKLSPQLSYIGSNIHRIHKGYIIQGGSLVSDAGHHQLSIYNNNNNNNNTFEAQEETDISLFHEKGLVGTAVSAPHLNGSQFFILTRNGGAPELDRSCICFGKVNDSESMKLVEEIESIEVSSLWRPIVKVRIVGAGVHV
eukprot:Tbor_TRINITY_DN5719_c4_g1::TRINITY_DN5719_c4_g1_i4::g.20388::m.20388/K09567/PPIH, CYPH; peptidyl-prolyl isomerase H (cyclophilin H)